MIWDMLKVFSCAFEAEIQYIVSRVPLVQPISKIILLVKFSREANLNGGDTGNCLVKKIISDLEKNQLHMVMSTIFRVAVILGILD